MSLHRGLLAGEIGLRIGADHGGIKADRRVDCDPRPEQEGNRRDGDDDQPDRHDLAPHLRLPRLLISPA